MTTIHDVADIRAKAQLNPQDRRAIKRSINMTLMGIAAVVAAVLLAPQEKSSTTAAGTNVSESTAVASPATATEPTEAVGSSFQLEFGASPGEKIETSWR